MSRIGKMYGQALYSLAQDENLADQVLEELDALRGIFSEEPRYLQLLSSPNLSKDERCKIADDTFRGKVQPYVLNFLKVLTEKGYARHFSECCDAYRVQYNEDRGILPVKAVAAAPVSEEQQERLKAKLEKITGKTVVLTVQVDPQCIGGIRLDYDGIQVDDTVRHRLEKVRSMLNNTVL